MQKREMFLKQRQSVKWSMTAKHSKEFYFTRMERKSWQHSSLTLELHYLAKMLENFLVHTFLFFFYSDDVDDLLKKSFLFCSTKICRKYAGVHWYLVQQLRIRVMSSKVIDREGMFVHNSFSEGNYQYL